MKYILFSIFFTLSCAVSGQYHYQNYSWGKPEPFPVVDSAAQKIVLLDKKMVEYAFENGMFVQLTLHHTIEYLHSSEAVESNNRKYLPFSSSSLVLDPMARVIKPDGSIIVLDESKVLESTDEETGRHYKYFAFEGAEPGCIVEYLYILKSSPQYTGKQEYVQGEYPVMRYEFDLYAPQTVFFDFKTYNTHVQFVEDSIIANQNHWSIAFDSVPGVSEEFLAPLDNLYVQFVYKIDRHGKETDAVSYAKAGTNIYKRLSVLAGRKDEKAIKRLLKTISFEGQNTFDDTICSVEYFLKKNFRIVDLSAPEFDKPADIEKSKLASEFGMTKLYFHMLKRLGIDFQIVLTCDRTRYPFDPDFESYHFLTHYLVYFPQSKKYLIPSEFAYRYGLIPPEFTDTYGLFIKETSLGDVSTGIASVGFIPATSCEQTFSNLDVHVAFADGMGDAQLAVKNMSGGYYSVYIQPYLELMNAEQYKDFVEREIKRLVPGAEIVSYSVHNDAGVDAGHKPFEIDYMLQNTGLLNTAGDRYLFKIGETIGPQFELYSEHQRSLPIYSDHTRIYRRTISVEIPEGYVVANFDDLFMKESMVQAEDTVLFFGSEAELNENLLTVTVVEYYDKLKFAVEEYDGYRRVINSASDFNKKILVLEPK